MKISPIAKSLDQVTLVNEHDEVIGEMDKLEAHRGDGKLHRAISVFLLRHQNGELQTLIQQRSAQKIVGAVQWANTCCGNVRPIENYEECAQRRLREELGIEGVSLRKLMKFQYFARCNDEFSEREIDTVFVGDFNGDVTPNPDEVQNTQWISLEELTQQLSNTDEEKNQHFVPWLKIMFREQNIGEKLCQE